MTKQIAVDAKFPRVWKPLFEPHRYKVSHGGRGGGKSWAFARALLLKAMQDPLRILCAREVMKTIAESVHQLLKDQIIEMGIVDFFVVQEHSIKGVNGSEFTFVGLRTLSIQNVKSYEGINICWVEEAHTVSKRSWGILIPTIRTPDSEIWVSFNPELDTDDTYTRFVLRSPPDAWVQRVTWKDNPYFPGVLEKERLHLKATDEEEYDHVWEGNPRSSVPGAIYSKEVRAMIQQGRFKDVPYDPRLPVDTIWDLGWNDQTAVIFAQRISSEVRIIDYEEESFLRYDEWARILKEKPYSYGQHWLPHDGGHKTQGGQGISARDQLKVFLKIRPKLIKQPPSIEYPITQARAMFPRVYMNSETCHVLMECLKRFQRAVPVTTQEPGRPMKTPYRHGADAFGGLAMIVDKIETVGSRAPTRAVEHQVLDAGMGM